MAVAFLPELAEPSLETLIGMPWDDYMAELADADEAWRGEDYVQGFKALMLSTDVATYQSLLKDRPVPVCRLDQVWAKRYGIL